MEDAASLVAILLAESAVAYRPFLSRALESPATALFLCQLLYWQPRSNDPEGWVMKKMLAERDKGGNMLRPSRSDAQSWEWELGLSRGEQTRARETLVGLGIVEAEKRPGPTLSPTWFFRVNHEALYQFLLANAHLSDQYRKTSKNHGTVDSCNTNRVENNEWNQGTVDSCNAHCRNRQSEPPESTTHISETRTQIFSETRTTHGCVFLRDVPPELRDAFWRAAHDLPIEIQSDIADELAGQLKFGKVEKPEGLLRALANAARAGTLALDFARRLRADRAGESHVAENRSKKIQCDAEACAKGSRFFSEETRKRIAGGEAS